MSSDSRGTPWYSDRCPYCRHRVVVAPMARFTARHGNGLVATYQCPAGHRWWTGWAWWQNRPHETDGMEAA